jgi:hypothetical protein
MGTSLLEAYHDMPDLKGAHRLLSCYIYEILAIDNCFSKSAGSNIVTTLAALHIDYKVFVAPLVPVDKHSTLAQFSHS